MPQPLRRVRQRIPKASVRPPRVLLHLPFLGVAALLVVFAVAVGWAFFMGVIIGQGQNPAERVDAMLHERPRETPPPAGPTVGERVADLLNTPLPLHKDGRGGDGRAAGGEGEPEADRSPSAPAGQPAARTEEGEQGAQASSAPQSREQAEQAGTEKAGTEKGKASAYPFARPQGESLAAWGIQPGGAGQAAQQTPGTASAARQTSAAARRAEQKAEPQKTEKAEPRFDYVYQTAAFRDKEDGDALRARLEEKGLRTRLQKSGKVYLVLVLLRGSEREAENVRETLRRMGLGKPIRLSKKAVK